MESGNISEYCFCNDYGRISANSICDCMRLKCSQAGIEPRGIHAIRRTFNSKLKCNGVSSTVTSALLGHTEEVNNNHYTYDITNMDYKSRVVEQVIGG